MNTKGKYPLIKREILIYSINWRKISPELHKNFNSVFLGIKVPNKRLKELILNGMLPKTTEEDAIFCYYQTLSLVQKKFYDLPTNPETIQELHFQLIHYITSDSAMWREKEFIVPGVPEYGMHSSSYRPLSRKLIPKSV